MDYKISNVKLSHDDLVNLFSTALYGCDWVELENDDDFYKQYDSIPEDKREGNCIEDVIADILLNGGSVTFYDLEDEVMYTRALDSFEFACSTEEGFEYAKTLFIDEDGDYYTANNLFQIALFGEVVYG